MEDNEKNIEAKILETNQEENKNQKVECQENKEEIKKNIKNENTYKVKTKNNSRKYIIIVSVISFILIFLAVFSTIFALINSNNTKILSGIYVDDILIEGLTEDEAKKILNDKYNNKKNKEIFLEINGESFSITPEQIEIEYNIEKAVEEAYNIGRKGNIFVNNFEILFSMIEENNIQIEFTYNEAILESILQGFNAKIPNSMTDNIYCVEDDELIITRGTDGIVIDIEHTKNSIIEAIKSDNKEKIEVKTKYEECPEIDILKIYSEVKSEPQNATYNEEMKELIPHKNGIDFDLEKAKQLLKEEKEEYILKLIIIEPDILTNEIGEEAFPDLLSSFSTKYDETNIPRSKNLKLATAKLNGVVIMPGEIFSYNETLGKRTSEAGYEYANGFAGGKVVPMLAGGICQISSTLYDAVLYANLNIVERHNHMFQATYVDPGKDATVVYGSLDFKFENTRSYPIMLKAKASGGLAEIKIYGIKEEIEYDVEIITNVLSYTPYSVVYQNDSSLAPGQEKVTQWGLQGCKSITYRVIKQNGQEVSREVLSSDTYDPLSKIINRGPSKTVDTSTEPDNSENQDVPETKPESQIPETPKEQDGIQKPEISETPEVPETPVNPEPDTPKNPDVTEEQKPVTPETPEIPEGSEIIET